MNTQALLLELQTTEDAARRNAIAITLSDRKCNAAIPILVALIKNPQYANNIGTLIYALGNLDCADSLCEILPILFHGNWEASHQLFLVFREQYPHMNETSKANCRAVLAAEKERAEDTLDLIAACLDIASFDL